eukprot:4720727-Prymnesium_polylepis.1
MIRSSRTSAWSSANPSRVHAYAAPAESPAAAEGEADDASESHHSRTSPSVEHTEVIECFNLKDAEAAHVQGASKDEEAAVKFPGLHPSCHVDSTRDTDMRATSNSTRSRCLSRRSKHVTHRKKGSLTERVTHNLLRRVSSKYDETIGPQNIHHVAIHLALAAEGLHPLERVFWVLLCIVVAALQFLAAFAVVSSLFYRTCRGGAHLDECPEGYCERGQF